MSQAIIRRAVPADAAHIIIAHVRSIRETCAKDYTPEQIRAWAGRNFSTENWLKRIEDSWVWVVELDGFVEGVAFVRKLNDQHCFMDALYFTPAVQGRGLGRQLMAIVLQEARKQGFHEVQLSATLTAYDFYRKTGFVDDPARENKHVFNGVEIPCTAMKMSLL